jgi:hypothetical protein
VPLARREADPPPPGATSSAAPLGDTIPSAQAGRDSVVCAACGGFVAESLARSSVNGAHSHSFINPAGLVFRVACFAEAPGVLALGEESLQFTWFAGFSWRVAVCRACTEHLGWCYRSAGSSFVALIEDRIVERRAPDGRPS